MHRTTDKARTREMRPWVPTLPPESHDRAQENTPTTGYLQCGECRISIMYADLAQRSDR
jgi:hypothetical protein